MKYFEVQDTQAVFSYIKKSLTAIEPAPDYEQDPGMFELEKVLNFIKNDTYYPTFEIKCAYLICSIAGSQHFQNGNKRLGTVLLMYFLAMNRSQRRSLDIAQFQELLELVFPKHHWEGETKIDDAHAQFLYNLAIVIGDNTKWDVTGFDQLKEKVATLFKYLYRLLPV